MFTAALDRRATRGWRSGIAGLLVGAFVFAALTAGNLADAAPASAADSTAVTVSAADYDKDVAEAPFPDLKITVSQTTGLISQGIEISWTGGKESAPPSNQTGGENFLQFAQCWAEDPERPGQPDRASCQYGAFLSPGARRDGTRAAVISEKDDAYTVPRQGSLDPAYTSIPFRSATGETIASVVDKKRVPGVDVNTNPFFTQYTSNEIPWAGSGADGTGSTKFEVQTAAQAQGLGCGSRVTAADGTVTGSPCWLVAIPRGTADVGESAITQSGLFWDSWKHHIAFKLDFRPVGVNCAIGAAERQLVGSELLATAVGSWQPALCGSSGGDVYNMITSNESDVVAQANAATETSPLALTSLAYSGEGPDNLIYAPVGLSAVTVAFAVDRFPKQDGSASEGALARARLPFESMKLTPTLVAKLLTNSYLDSLPYDADRSHLGRTIDGTFVPNPRNLLFDPAFLEINDPEWAEQAIAGVGVSDMLIPQGRSDVATMLWRYVMADAQARDFLDGKPDGSGMIVNKYASTNPKMNPTGIGLTLPRDNFPKADPTQVDAVPGGAAEVNLVTWRPYTNDLDSSGYFALRGDGQVLGAWDITVTPPRYQRTTRNLQGSQAVLALTDSSAAEKYQIVTASLQNPAGAFVAPTAEAMTAAAGAMTTTEAQPQVLALDVTSERARSASGAYPLTMPVYAAANPSMTDLDARRSYAAFIRYAATTGQEPGVQVGQLPPGYAPIPAGWRDAALIAARVIQDGLPPVTSGGESTPTASRDASGSDAVAAPAGSVSAVGAAAPAAAPPAGSGPTASGAIAGALTGAQTPADPDVAGLATTLPLSLLAGLLTTVAALVIPRLPRRT